MSRVQVEVAGKIQWPPGYPKGHEAEQNFAQIQFTNGEGVTGFLIPPVQSQIRVSVTGPPGFLNHTSEFGFLPKETKGIMIELQPVSSTGPAS